MGFLGPKAFEAVLGIITGGQGGGKTPTPFETYRGGTELESFFRKCGVDFYLKHHESRVPGARRALASINEDPEGFPVIKDIIETLIDEYDDDGDSGAMVKYLNKRLVLDGLQIVEDDDEPRLVRVGEDVELIDAVEKAVDWLNLDSVRSEIERARSHVETDPEDALTAACSTIESICKCLLDEMGMPYPAKQDISGLVKALSKYLDLSPGRANLTNDIKQILSGLISVTSGIGALRTHGGDAHGRGRKKTPVDARIARLAIHAASTVSLFYIETWNRMKRNG